MEPVTYEVLNKHSLLAFLYQCLLSLGFFILCNSPGGRCLHPHCIRPQNVLALSPRQHNCRWQCRMWNPGKPKPVTFSSRPLKTPCRAISKDPELFTDRASRIGHRGDRGEYSIDTPVIQKDSCSTKQPLLPCRVRPKAMHF